MSFRGSGRLFWVVLLLCISLLLILNFTRITSNTIQQTAVRLNLSVRDAFWKNLSYTAGEKNSDNSTKTPIQILVVIEPDTKPEYYQHAFDSLRCYAKIHNYDLQIVLTSQFSKECPHKDKFFRRHCVAVQLLHNADWTLFIDADIGVVNPKRIIEEYIDDRFEITFYDRFYNFEVMAGAYLVKNTDWSREFLKGWADYEYKLPKSFHGTDNGAIHAYLASVIFPNRTSEYSHCLEIYNISKWYDDLFAYEACIRAVLGISEHFGNIRILRKGTGWARDNWLTNSKWSPDRDFMIHGWKLNQLRKYDKSELPLPIQERSRGEWYNPLAGPIHLDKCHPGNSTWNYDENLITSSAAIKEKLQKLFNDVENDRYVKLGHIAKRLKSR